jgi:hypothetical protein
MPPTTVWVEVPTEWIRAQGAYTFLHDDNGHTLGPVLAVENEPPTAPRS